MTWCLFAVLLASCQSPRQTLTRFQITSLKALDLEETITRGDELLMAYTLTAFDAAGKAVGVTNGSWGVQSAKSGQVFSEPAFQPIEIPFPKNGKVVATVVLIEIDDYAQAQKTLTEIRKFQNYIRLPAALAELADITLTPLKYIALGLTAAGVGFQMADRLDNDDILGQNSTELSYQNALDTPLTQVPLTFKEGRMANSFHYELTYDLRTQTVRMKSRQKPKS